MRFVVRPDNDLAKSLGNQAPAADHEAFPDHEAGLPRYEHFSGDKLPANAVLLHAEEYDDSDDDGPGDDELAKSRNAPKYIRREATGTPGRKWRYFYYVPGHGVVTSDSIKEGTRYAGKHEHQGKTHEGHYEIVQHHADTGHVTVKHTGSGQTVKMATHEFAGHVNVQHATAHAGRKAEKVQEIKDAVDVLKGKPANAAQAKRVQKLTDDAVRAGWLKADEAHQLAQASKPKEATPLRTRRTHTGRSAKDTPGKVGDVFRDHDGRYVVINKLDKPSYVREDGLSFGLDDDQGWHHGYTVREATADEAKPLREHHEAETKATQSKQQRAERTSKLIAAFKDATEKDDWKIPPDAKIGEKVVIDDEKARSQWRQGRTTTAMIDKEHGKIHLNSDWVVPDDWRETSKTLPYSPELEREIRDVAAGNAQKAPELVRPAVNVGAEPKADTAPEKAAAPGNANEAKPKAKPKPKAGKVEKNQAATETAPEAAPAPAAEAPPPELPAVHIAGAGTNWKNPGEVFVEPQTGRPVVATERSKSVQMEDARGTTVHTLHTPIREATPEEIEPHKERLQIESGKIAEHRDALARAHQTLSWADYVAARDTKGQGGQKGHNDVHNLRELGQKHDTTDGVLRNPFFEEGDYRTTRKNWMATVKPNRAAPGGLERAWIEGVRGKEYGKVGHLKPGDVVEFGHTGTDKKGRDIGGKHYAAVWGVGENHIHLSPLHDNHAAAAAASKKIPKHVGKAGEPLAKSASGGRFVVRPDADTADRSLLGRIGGTSRLAKALFRTDSSVVPALTDSEAEGYYRAWVRCRARNWLASGYDYALDNSYSVETRGELVTAVIEGATIRRPSDPALHQAMRSLGERVQAVTEGEVASIVPMDAVPEWLREKRLNSVNKPAMAHPVGY